MAEATADFLRQQAARFRRLAREVNDARAHQALIELAEEYEARAAEGLSSPPSTTE